MKVLERQRKNDIYFAERASAHATFVKIFGKEFADGSITLSNEPKFT